MAFGRRKGLFTKRSRRRRARSWALVGAVVLVLAVAGAALTALANAPWGGQSRSDAFDGDELVVDNRTHGRVHVTGTDGDQVTVERTLRGAPLSTPSEQVGLVGDTVRADASCQGPRFLGGCRVDYEIGVPAGTEITVQTRSGAVRASSVEGAVNLSSTSGTVEVQQVVGDVTAAATSGRIRVSGAQGDLDLQTTSGSIRAEGSGEEIRAKASSGRVELSGFSAAAVEAETSSGRIVVDGVFTTADVHTSSGGATVTAAGAFDQLAATSTSGRIDIRVPDDTYRVSAETTSGRRDVDVDTSEDASATIEASATSGSVRIRAGS